MTLVSVEEGKLLLAELVGLQREVQTKVDKRGAGWRVFLRTRQVLEIMTGPLPQDDPSLTEFVGRAVPLLQKKLQEMEQVNAFNPLSVQFHERSEIDLFVLQKKLEDESEKVRLDAVAAVGELEWKDALGVLQEMLTGEAHPFVVSKLVKVVGQLGGSGDLATLARFLEHEDERIRANAIEGIEALPGDEKFTVILPMLEDASPRVRANALKVIRGLGDSRFSQVVKWMMHHPELEYRRSVLYVLGMMKGAFAHSCLLDMLQDHHPDIRGKVISILARRPEMASVEALVDLMRAEDSSEKSREQAMEGLRTLLTAIPPELSAQVERALREAVAGLGVRYTEITGVAVPASGGTLLDQLEELARPPERPAPDPPSAPPRPTSSPGGGSEAQDDAKDKAESDARKVLARMKTAISLLDAREKTEAEKLIRAGRIVNESQLKTVVQRLRAKRKGK